MLDRRSFAGALVLGLVASSGLAQPGEPTTVPDPEPAAPEPIIEKTIRGDALIESAAPGWDYPKALAARPLTMKKFMIRGTFSVGVKRAVIDPNTGALAGRALVALDFGAAFSPRDNLEVGVSHYRLGSSTPIVGQGFFPVVVSPQGTFGDMPVYVRYSFMQKEYVEMAADFVLSIPTWTNLAAKVGLPTRIRVRDTVTIDTGTELVVLSNGAGLNVGVPFNVTYNPTPAGFVFAESGFSFENLARNITGGSYIDSNLAFPVARNQVLVPLSVGGGYTHVVKNIVMLDLFARVGWNPLVYINPPSGTDVVPVSEGWLLSVGMLIHASPILQQ